MRMFILVCLALLCLAGGVLAQAAPDAFVAKRHELAHRQRRIILNDDGNVVIYYPKSLPLTAENVLVQRTSPLLGSQVDSLFYCPISSGFSYFTHNTKVGAVLEHPIADKSGDYVPSTRNITRDLINQGTDALKMIVDFARANRIEVFFSMRMNDTHDAAHSPDNPYPLFPPLKEQHPDWLIGSRDKRSPYAPWSSVDYTRPEIRDLAFRFCQEVCQNYDVDGVELDFFRHMAYFKSVGWGGTASQAELDMMTDLVRRLRAMADEEGRKRGRPILIAMRVPDSVEYSKGVGLDLERWLSEGLVDLLVGSGYFQLNPWETLVALGHKYNVPVYPSLDESRVRSDGPPYKRNASEAYRARAARVWQSGADGVYLFNFFSPKAPMLREIGDPATLAGLDKTYFVTVRNYSPDMYLKGGTACRTLPLLSPDNPMALAPGKPLTVPIYLGEQPARAGAAQPQVKLCLLASGPQAPQAALNGTALPAGQAAGKWWEYAVPPQAVKPGENRVAVSLAPQAAGTDQPWEVSWTGDKKPAQPWSSDRPSADVTAEIKDGALLIADRGIAGGNYLYYYYSWNASPEREAMAEVEVKAISGLSNIIVSNGVACDRVGIFPDHIAMYSTHARYDMNTTDDFHTYRLELKGQDLKVLVDGKVALDSTGKFTDPSPAGRNALQIGAATSSELGEALWRAVRLRTGAMTLFDLVMRFDYP
ncbi:family 10 glycosylhydrolase [bacterium]|nr:family 10 glycosylhydrolase [bacterium]